MNNERITYEEFMIMFRNAPRVAYTLYDKAEDEIDRLNSIISELEKWLSEFETKEFNYNFLVVRVKDIQDKLKALKDDSNLPEI